ncbi:hypothetical protein L9F63_026617, partial [Diploptera punctata]
LWQFEDGAVVAVVSLAKRRGTTSLTTTAYSPKIFKIIIATPAVNVYVNKNKNYGDYINRRLLLSFQLSRNRILVLQG